MGIYAQILRYSFSAMILVLAFASCFAAEHHRWVVMGIGSDSCGKYLAARQGAKLGMVESFKRPDGMEFFDKSESYNSWIAGFITGINLSDANGNNQTNVDPESLEVWLRRYCLDNPVQPLYSAVSLFARQIQGSAVH